MYIVLGGTGHVGSAVADALLRRGEPVTVVAHSAPRGRHWEQKGAQVAVADVHDVESLRSVFRRGRRLFLLNPNAKPSTDTDVEERATVASIVAALEGSGLERIVAESTYGAQPGERIGDLTVLYGLEQALNAQSIPACVIRAAYYFSNWDASLATARDQGVVRTMFSADFTLPMVAPSDLGEVAARLLLDSTQGTGIHYVEGPERYSSADVAAAFASALNRSVRAESVPRGQWTEAFRKMGFSDAAAESYARMTAVTADAKDSFPEPTVRGQTSLRAYISALVSAEHAARRRAGT